MKRSMFLLAFIMIIPLAYPQDCYTDTSFIDSRVDVCCEGYEPVQVTPSASLASFCVHDNCDARCLRPQPRECQTGAMSSRNDVCCEGYTAVDLGAKAEYIWDSIRCTAFSGACDAVCMQQGYVDETGDVIDPLTWYEGLMILAILSTVVLTWRAYLMMFPKMKKEKSSFIALWKTEMAVGLSVIGLKRIEDEKFRKAVLLVRLSMLAMLILAAVYLYSVYIGSGLAG